MSCEAMVTLAFGIVIGAAIVVSGLVHGYVTGVRKHIVKQETKKS